MGIFSKISDGARAVGGRLFGGTRGEAATDPVGAPAPGAPEHIRRQRARAARAAASGRRRSIFSARWSITRAGRLMDGLPTGGETRRCLRRRLRGGA